MIKLFKFLIVTLLLLSASALVLGIALYQKRSLLMLRTAKLENALMAVGAQIESVEPGLDSVPIYPERDIDDVTARLLDEPRRAEFWPGYDHALEVGVEETIDLRKQRAQLARFYKVDPITTKPLRDPLTGQKITEGPGTMQALLDDVEEKAAAQLLRLNQTRQQLRGTREELVGSISRLNESKHDLRLALGSIEDRDGTIANLNQQVEHRDVRIVDLERDTLDLSEKIEIQEGEIEQQREDIVWLEKTIEEKERIIAILSIPDRTPPGSWPSITPGYKGTVASVNEDWDFVLLSLSDEFLEQYQTEHLRHNRAPDPAFAVWRKSNGSGAYVSQVRLTRVDPETGIGIANIDSEWPPAEVQAGDQLIY